ncbi:MAG: hypothetical protein HY675_22515 [Chloroflexi bacterium]|nr:hypothetical protein [Chloroflexota bacterium]
MVKTVGVTNGRWGTMCRKCGCADFISQGREATLARAVAIIDELGVTVDNVQAFEDGERICGLIASRLAGAEEEEIRETADWVSGLHQYLWAERHRAYVGAACRVFDNLPAAGAPRDIITTFHQLEQLCRILGDEITFPPGQEALGDVICAVNHVHDDNQRHFAELRERYGLSGV